MEIEEITELQMEEILGIGGYPFEKLGLGIYQIKISMQAIGRIIMMSGKNDTALLLKLVIIDQTVTNDKMRAFHKINTWNESHLFSKAYLSSKGSIVLCSEIPLQFGTTFNTPLQMVCMFVEGFVHMFIEHLDSD